jgi:hypothetical protein
MKAAARERSVSEPGACRAPPENAAAGPACARESNSCALPDLAVASRHEPARCAGAPERCASSEHPGAAACCVDVALLSHAFQARGRFGSLTPLRNARMARLVAR